MIKVFLADDHDIVRSGLRGLLEEVPDMQVCGEAATVTDLLALLPTVKADALILDVSMPGHKGPKTVEDICSLHKPPKVIVFTMYREDSHAVPYLRAGASAFVSKRRPTSDLLEAIRASQRHETYLPDEVADHLDEQGVDLQAPIEPDLTQRERQILRLLLEGYRSVAIATEIGVTASTVNTHVQNIKHKLGLSSLVDLVRYAEQYSDSL